MNDFAFRYIIIVIIFSIKCQKNIPTYFNPGWAEANFLLGAIVINSAAKNEISQNLLKRLQAPAPPNKFLSKQYSR